MSTAPAPVLEVTVAQRTAVEAALRRRDLTPRVRERLEMVKAAGLGQDLDEIAQWTGRTPETVRRWLAVFQAGGIVALADAPRQGRPPKADAAYRTALQTAVATPPRRVGLPFDVWTSERLSVSLAQQTGTRIAPGWLRVLLQRQRFVCGRPKHTLAQLQDAEEVAACQGALREAGGKRCGRNRNALRGTTRTRPIWTPIPT
jgi:transposase